MVVLELEIGLIRIETAEQFAILGAVLKGLRYGRKLLNSLSQFLITYILIHDGGQGVDYWLIYIRHPFIDILTYGIRKKTEITDVVHQNVVVIRANGPNYGRRIPKSGVCP